jgi:hypothetical protein
MSFYSSRDPLTEKIQARGMCRCLRCTLRFRPIPSADFLVAWKKYCTRMPGQKGHNNSEGDACASSFFSTCLFGVCLFFHDVAHARSLNI